MARKAPLVNVFAPLLAGRPPPLGMTRPAYCNVDANPYTRVQALLTQRLRMPECAAARPSPGFAERLAAACSRRGLPELAPKPFVPVRSLHTTLLRTPPCIFAPAATPAAAPPLYLPQRMRSAAAPRTRPPHCRHGRGTERAHCKQHVQGVDVADVHVLRAAGGAFDAYRPATSDPQAELVRQLALDGGVRPQGTSACITLRFKYAFDGCGCAAAEALL